MMTTNHKSYKIYFILFFFIVILFIILHYVYNQKTMYIDVFGKSYKENSKIMIKKNNEYYLSYSFVKENIDSGIYFDNISKKIVISQETLFIKAKKDEKIITNNSKIQELNNVGVIEDKDVYISLEVLRKSYNFEITILNNTIYIYENNNFECSLKSNKISLYQKNDNKSKSTKTNR